MKSELFISDEQKMVIVIAEGSCQFEDIKTIIHKVMTDPRYNKNYDILIDLQEIQYNAVISEIFSISEYIITFKKKIIGSTAIIVKSDVLYNLFKLSTMFVSKEGIQTSIFKNKEEALTWLESSAKQE